MSYRHRPEVAAKGETTYRIKYGYPKVTKAVHLAVGDHIKTEGTFSGRFDVQGEIKKISYDADTCEGDRPSVGYELLIRGKNAIGEEGNLEVPVCQLFSIRRVRGK